MSFNNYKVPYPTDKRYGKKVAYFSMEFAVHQPLKIYSGGLGFLSGSHMRSAYELKQNLIGIGILWKYGYYDQARNQDQTLQVQWNEKIYNFLEIDNFDHDFGGAPQGTNRSFIDATWIKNYNGSSRPGGGSGYYYNIIRDTPTSKPSWIIFNLNNQNHNYVEAVSNRAE